MRETRIEGFDERIEETIIRSGMSRSEITKKMGAKGAGGGAPCDTVNEAILYFEKLLKGEKNGTI